MGGKKRSRIIPTRFYRLKPHRFLMVLPGTNAPAPAAGYGPLHQARCGDRDSEVLQYTWPVCACRWTTAWREAVNFIDRIKTCEYITAKFGLPVWLLTRLRQSGGFPAHHGGQIWPWYPKIGAEHWIHPSSIDIPRRPQGTWAIASLSHCNHGTLVCSMHWRYPPWTLGIRGHHSLDLILGHGWHEGEFLWSNRALCRGAAVGETGEGAGIENSIHGPNLWWWWQPKPKQLDGFKHIGWVSVTQLFSVLCVFPGPGGIRWYIFGNWIQFHFLFGVPSCFFNSNARPRLACIMVLQAKWTKFLVLLGICCSTFVAISRGSTLRSEFLPQGCPISLAVYRANKGFCR